MKKLRELSSSTAEVKTKKEYRGRGSEFSGPLFVSACPVFMSSFCEKYSFSVRITHIQLLFKSIIKPPAYAILRKQAVFALAEKEGFEYSFTRF